MEKMQVGVAGIERKEYGERMRDEKRKGKSNNYVLGETEKKDTLR